MFHGKERGMPLDFVAAKRKRMINGSEAMFSLEERLHEKILSLAVPRKEFPTVGKIADYYADATIVLGELKRFRNEILIIANASQDSELFSELLSFVEQTILAENNLYVQAD